MLGQVSSTSSAVAVPTRDEIWDQLCSIQQMGGKVSSFLRNQSSVLKPFISSLRRRPAANRIHARIAGRPRLRHLLRRRAGRARAARGGPGRRRGGGRGRAVVQRDLVRGRIERILIIGRLMVWPMFITQSLDRWFDL
jgi:hypothetical protein